MSATVEMIETRVIGDVSVTRTVKADGVQGFTPEALFAWLKQRDEVDFYHPARRTPHADTTTTGWTT